MCVRVCCRLPSFTSGVTNTFNIIDTQHIDYHHHLLPFIHTATYTTDKVIINSIYIPHTKVKPFLMSECMSGCEMYYQSNYGVKVRGCFA